MNEEELMMKHSLKDKARPGFGLCSSINIELRQKQVRCNRDLHWISKGLEGIQREHAKNMRKFDSAQRGLMLLIGESPYPDCSREEASFLHNQPGFCFRSDGNPRYFSSLHESKSRKILSDMDGKEGLRPNPALNVVSDTPTLAEILSSPELVQILCELRNTAALMTDENLFKSFASQLARSHKKFPFFKEFQGPLDYLKQYRKNLIQEFFDTLKTEAEMRLFVTPVDHVTNLIQEQFLGGLDDKSLLGSSIGSNGGGNSGKGSAGTKSGSSAVKSVVSSAGNEEDSSSASFVNNSNSSNKNNNSASENEAVLDSSTSKEDDRRSVGSNQSYTPNLIDRLQPKVKKNKKTMFFGGAPPPPHSKEEKSGLLRSEDRQDEDNKRKDGHLLPPHHQQHQRQYVDSDTTSFHGSDSKADIFAPTDFIPTSKGYMTVEDWNYAVLQQLRKARDDEVKKKADRSRWKKVEKILPPPSTDKVDKEKGLSSLHHRHQERNEIHAGDLENNNLTIMDHETEELQKQMAAAKAAEEEAKYRLDQKIMGLAGITSLYKSNNIGFAKYFEQKDDLLERELRKRDEEEEGSSRRRRHKNRRSSKEGRGDKNEDENYFGDEGGSRPVRFQSTEALRKNRKQRKSTSSNISLASSAASDASSLEGGDLGSGSRLRLNAVAKSSSRRRIMRSKSKMKRATSVARNRIFHRQEFDVFVKGLINNLEEISAVGKQVSGLSKRRPVQVKQFINPLLRLLKRDDLFETLNDEDIFFSEFEGGKKGLEKMVAAQLPSNAKPTTAAATTAVVGGPYHYKLPSRTSVRTGDGGSIISGESVGLGSRLGVEDFSSFPNNNSRLTLMSPPYSAHSSSGKSSTAVSSNIGENESRFGSKPNFKARGLDPDASSVNVQLIPKSLQRVCCPACRAKTQQACNSVLRRDKNCKLILSMNTWKIPGMHTPHWIRKQKEKDSIQLTDPYYPQKLIGKVPLKLRRSYESKFPIFVEERSRSVFLNPPSQDVMSMPIVKQAAPTPVYLKKKLYPLAAVSRITQSQLASNLRSSSSKAIPQTRSKKVRVQESPKFAAGGDATTGFIIQKRKLDGKKDSVNSLLPEDAKSLIHRTTSSELKDAAAKAPPPPPPLILERNSSTFNKNKATSSNLNLKQRNLNIRTKGEGTTPAKEGKEQRSDAKSKSFLDRASGTDFKNNFESWTLKVSKFDILRLRHELDGESVKEKMANFESKFLRTDNP